MSKFSVDQVMTLVAAAKDSNADWRVDYSGRGMMGKRCFGITGDDGTLWDYAVELALQDEHLAIEINAPRRDAMGRATIFYWPAVEITDEMSVTINSQAEEVE